MPTESAQQALSQLRDPSNFQWYVIPLLVIVLYIYHDQIGRKNYSVVFAGLALWGMDWFNETWNSLIFYSFATWRTTSRLLAISPSAKRKRFFAACCNSGSNKTSSNADSFTMRPNSRALAMPIFLFPVVNAR